MQTAGVTRRIRIFLSSPSDVTDERNQYAAVVQELNLTLAALLPDRSVVLELIRWETHTHPDLVGEPQQTVDQQIESDYDVFVGIMWTRFGTPTSTSGSGTAQEFHAAWNMHKKRGQPAHLLFYFCNAPVPPRLTTGRLQQLAKVNDFRTELEHLGLVGHYDSRSDFGDRARRDLIQVVGRLLHPDRSAAEIAGRVAERAPDGDVDLIRTQVAQLAHDYDSVREAMSGGPERTMRLEVIASRMRALAPSAFAIMPELMASPDPGTRLAAICALQVVPDAHHLWWLAERMTPEQPFIAYHAAIALLAAARDLNADELDQVNDALAEAEARTQEVGPDSDRARTLRRARAELDTRRSPIDRWARSR